MILGLLEEAIEAGARQKPACEILGLDPRTIERWRSQGVGDDGRAGARKAPQNKLSSKEREKLLKVVNEPEHRNLSPKQIVPRLADQGVYLASESTMYRVLREENQLQHRSASRPATHARPRELVATGPNQVWSWDITYLKSPILGRFFYLYLMVDVWSRKIVGAAVHPAERDELAAELLRVACAAEGVHEGQLTVHSDNGGPMKGATMVATLDRLGVRSSFSRPHVSDDNPYSESLFRTLKYRPEFPDGPFASLEAARDWVWHFVGWYNEEHRHSAIRFVTPAQRHAGEDVPILARRHAVYAAARTRHPERWSGDTRNWSPVDVVTLNPQRLPGAAGATGAA